LVATNTRSPGQVV